MLMHRALQAIHLRAETLGAPEALLLLRGIRKLQVRRCTLAAAAAAAAAAAVDAATAAVAVAAAAVAAAAAG